MQASPLHLCGRNQHRFQEVAPGSQTVTTWLRHLSLQAMVSDQELKYQFSVIIKTIKPLVAQSCSTLGDPLDDSPPGSSVHGILRLGLGGLPFPSPEGPSRPGNEPQVSCAAADSLPSEPPGVRRRCLKSAAPSPVISGSLSLSCFLSSLLLVNSCSVWNPSETSRIQNLSLLAPWSDFTPECPTRMPAPAHPAGWLRSSLHPGLWQDLQLLCTPLPVPSAGPSDGL